MKKSLLFLILLTSFSISAKPKVLKLRNSKINLEWTNVNGFWVMSKLTYIPNNKSFGMPVGQYTLLYSSKKPDDTKGVPIIENGDTIKILDKNNSHGTRTWVSQRATSEVPMNRAGVALNFFPTNANETQQGVEFESNTIYGKYVVNYTLDKKFDEDILLAITFTANSDGYYSLASPTLAKIKNNELRWGIVPGYFQGNIIQKNISLAYTYAQGLPKYPILCRENTITTLCSIISSKNGLTLGVTPNAGQDRNPYPFNKNEHNTTWKVALSHMNRKSELSPTAYHPVLGEEGSYLKKNQTVKFTMRYTIKNSDWYAVYRHAIYDEYQLKNTLKLKETSLSLSERLLSLYDYVCNDSVSMWRVTDFTGKLKIGAQDYVGAVKGSNKDAMKNSDVASVWMLAQVTKDKKITTERLPYIRNYKCAQQETENNFFHGAALGQYYLHKSKTFVEEWGAYVEPIGLTYYTLIDIGNILLFNPHDSELLEFFRNGANRLLKWQKNDGSFEVAYDKETEKPLYSDLKDLRPTFYGFIVAYRITGDKKYLDAAEKGAFWFIKNAVDKGRFLGVCGDYRFVNDFATGQSAQVLLDLYDITKKQLYLDAAIKTAKMYTTSIFTHPIPTNENRLVKEKTWKDWQLSQVGLSFEHGGSMGSAVIHGPILLASHAGLFMRMFTITQDSLFMDLARAGVLGRDAFLNTQNKVASYYWSKFDLGAGPYPQHAWWQIGWITDYLIAEAEVRTHGEISFPRGFCTPKVGSHQPIGFKSGKYKGLDVDFIMRKNFIKLDNPNVDYVVLQSVENKKVFVILLNQNANISSVSISANMKEISSDNMNIYEADVKLESFGVKVLEFNY